MKYEDTCNCVMAIVWVGLVGEWVGGWVGALWGESIMWAYVDMAPTSNRATNF